MSDPTSTGEPDAIAKDASYQAGYDAARKEAEAKSDEDDWERTKAFQEVACQEGRTLATMLRSLPKYDGTGVGNTVRRHIFRSMIHVAKRIRGDA
jgi:hypothetical protein